MSNESQIIIDLSNLTPEKIEAFFPSEYAKPRETEEENEAEESVQTHRERRSR